MVPTLGATALHRLDGPSSYAFSSLVSTYNDRPIEDGRLWGFSH